MPKLPETICASRIALAERFVGAHGAYLIVRDAFSKGAEISRFYFDQKYCFRFEADSMEVPGGQHIFVSPTIWRAGTNRQERIEDEDLEYIEQNLTDYFFHQDAFVWRGAVLAALYPIAVQFAWRLS